MNKLTNIFQNKTVTPTLIVSAICAFLAFLTTVSWLMPVVRLGNESYTMMKVLDSYHGSDAGAAAAGFWFVVILCAVSILWAVIPKTWAVVTGVVYSILPMALCLAQLSDWESSNLDLAIGAKLLGPCAVLVFCAFAMRLLVLVIEKKQSKTDSAAETQTAA